MHSADRVRNVPLFSGLTPPEIESILGISRYIAFAPGTHLMRQGQPADGVLILESGAADVLSALPGGGALTLASVGAGCVLGEMALLDAGVRSATVVARTPVDGYWIDRDGFRMLLTQRNSAVFTVQGRITLALCERLRDLNAKIVAREAPSNNAWSHAGRAPPPIRRGACTFNYRAFLPILPVFRGLDVEDVEELTAHAVVLDAPRGAVLVEPGTPSTACYVVVRGAIEVSTSHAGARHRIGVLGPGRLCGHMGLIDGVPHGATMAARENSTLLEIAKPEFDRLYHGRERTNTKFRDAINRNLLEALAHTNNHLTRLISQARIREQGASGASDINALERMLGTQDCGVPTAGAALR
jgi:CRP/FNR family cyclic AMP-dependent transcriptional regulator